MVNKIWVQLTRGWIQVGPSGKCSLWDDYTSGHSAAAPLVAGGLWAYVHEIFNALFIWHTQTTWHCFQTALLWHCTGPTDCTVAQGLGIVLILSRLLLFVNNVVWLYIGRNMHPWKGQLSSRFARPHIVNKLWVQLTTGWIQVGPYGKCSLREVFTSGRCAAAPLIAGRLQPL